jgi:antirestriction protein
MHNEADPWGPDPVSLEMRVIHEGLMKAEREGVSIDDRTARLIAGQLHGGQTTAFYSLASCGAVDRDGIEREILATYEEASAVDKRWYDHIDRYSIDHEGRGPVEGWHLLTGDREMQAALISLEALGAIAIEGDEFGKQHPRIWVGDTAAYQQGVLHGEWFRADRPADELRADITTMLATSPVPGAEDVLIVDQEGFGPLELGDVLDLDQLSRLALGIQERGEAYAYFVAHHGIGLLEFCENMFTDLFIGEFATTEDIAEHLWTTLGWGDAIQQARDSLPRTLRAWLIFDTAGFKEQLREDMHLAQKPDGTWLAFWDP